VFDTNVLGTLLGMKHEMRVMAAQGGGSIVNLSSVLGKVGAPGAAVYTASKHAVEGLTKAAALEGAASDVRVNAVAPGPVETEMLNRFTGGGERKADFLDTVPVKRAATPEEIADTILFLACKAPFLTGQSIVVDGGRQQRNSPASADEKAPPISIDLTGEGLARNHNTSKTL
jgi:NAD(P)-dependent dehydrogenase (short-subunit alcohol dehydrogenase family)